MDDEREDDGEVDKLAQEVVLAEYKLRIAELEFEVLREKQANRDWAERYSVNISLKRDQENENAFLRKRLEYRRNWSKVLTEKIIRLHSLIEENCSFNEGPVEVCEHGIIVIEGGVAICDECREKY